MVDHADHRDEIQGAVEASVPASVEPVPSGVARGSRYGIHAGESGERGLVAEPSWVDQVTRTVAAVNGNPVSRSRTSHVRTRRVAAHSAADDTSKARLSCWSRERARR